MRMHLNLKKTLKRVLMNPNNQKKVPDMSVFIKICLETCGNTIQQNSNNSLNNNLINKFISIRI